jgi:hypothetical protein
LLNINDALKNELQMIVVAIETQYNKMKDDKRKDIDSLKIRVDEDEEVRGKEVKLRIAQGKGNLLI